MKTLKVTLAVASTLLAALCLAEPVSEEMAVKAAGNWRVRRGQLGAKLGAKVRSARRVDHKGAAFHVVRFEGGGYAVTPTDTTIRPILLFSEGDDFAVDERNPALELLVRELSPLSVQEAAQTSQTSLSRAEAAWSELLDDRLPLEKGGKAQIDVIYVDPIVKTQWDQGSVGGQPCYNYYTPSNYVCGCVATAGSQILRTLKFPNTPVTPFTGNCLVDGQPVDLTAQGGLYDWDNMPEAPEQVALTDTQRRAIGKLTSDVGISVDMGYAAGGSGSGTYRLQYAFKQFFGLPHVCFGFARSRPSAAIDDAMGEVMRANFDAKLPVAIGIYGHSIVGDGYGYLGDTLYYHLNMGWGVGSNVWYAPPDDFGSWKGFEYACHNIYTNAAMNNLVIASGRLTDVHGQPLEGVRVWAEDDAGAQVGEAVESDVRGIYALFVPPGKYRVRAKELVRDDNGRPLYELVGETTSSPTKCSTVETVKDDRGWDYWDDEGDYVICGNDSGCDMALEPVTREPTVSLGELVLSTDFSSVSVPVTARAYYFGSATTPATLAVSLCEGETVLDTKNFELEDETEHTFNATFANLELGKVYTLHATLSYGEEPLVVADPESFATVSIVEITQPKADVLAAQYVVADLCIDSFTIYEQRTNVTASAAVTAFERDDGTGEFAVWTGTEWRRTGVMTELHVTNHVAVLHQPNETPQYLLWKNSAWVDLGGAPTQPAQYAEVSVDGTAQLLALKGVDYSFPWIPTEGELIENGGFETFDTPVFPSYELANAFPVSLTGNWKGASEVVYSNDRYFGLWRMGSMTPGGTEVLNGAPHGGSYAVAVHGGRAQGPYVATSFTTPSSTMRESIFELKFYVSAERASDPESAQFEVQLVSADGSTILAPSFGSATGTVGSNWTLQTIQYTNLVAEANYEIRFRNNVEDKGFELDDVSMKVVGGVAPAVVYGGKTYVVAVGGDILQKIVQGGAETPEEISAALVADRKGEGNGMTLFVCNALGLDPDNPNSVPITAMSQTSDENKITLVMGNANWKPVMGVVTKFVALESETPAGTMTPVQGQEESAEPTVSVSVPSVEKPVKYYKIGWRFDTP